jgi:carbonic anhydrase/acetyltransferase-like protein (isoleucine patch superfamily)
MRIRHRGQSPRIDPTAFAAPTAVLVGKVTVGPRARILYGAVLDSEGSRVEVGEASIVSENAVLRATAVGTVDAPVLIADHVFVGPHATLLGCTVESGAFLGTGATVLQGAVVRSGGVVGVGALVHARTVVPGGVFVPPNAVALGDPLRIYGPGDGESLVRAIQEIEFSRTAFGVEVSGRERHAIYEDVTETRSAEYAAHLDDEVLGDAE